MNTNPQGFRLSYEFVLWVCLIFVLYLSYICLIGNLEVFTASSPEPSVTNQGSAA
jgi:hypothetical protein